MPAGVDQAAYVKAAFLTDLAHGKVESPLVCRQHAVQLLGTMLGGYNVGTLIRTAGRRYPGAGRGAGAVAHHPDLRRLP